MVVAEGKCLQATEQSVWIFYDSQESLWNTVPMDRSSGKNLVSLHFESSIGEPDIRGLSFNTCSSQNGKKSDRWNRYHKERSTDEVANVDSIEQFIAQTWITSHYNDSLETKLHRKRDSFSRRMWRFRYVSFDYHRSMFSRISSNLFHPCWVY